VVCPTNRTDWIDVNSIFCRALVEGLKPVTTWDEDWLVPSDRELEGGRIDQNARNPPKSLFWSMVVKFSGSRFYAEWTISRGSCRIACAHKWKNNLERESTLNTTISCANRVFVTDPSFEKCHLVHPPTWRELTELESEISKSIPEVGTRFVGRSTLSYL